MIPVLEFIFASGWRFAGSIALILAVAVPLGQFRPIRIIIERE